MLIFILPILFVVLSNYIVERSAKGKTFNSIEQISYNKVGVVLGTSKYLVKGGINLYFKFRIDAAVRLYNSGKIDFILVSGDNGTQSYNEPETIKKELLKAGIPENVIFLDYAGFRTLDSVIRAKKVFGQAKFTLISQEFHNKRAIFLANQNGIQAVGYNAKDVAKNKGMKTKVREYFARSKAVLDVIFGVKSKFLGDTIEIQ